MPHRLLLADDHQLFLDGLRLLVGGMEGWEVVGEARTGREVLNALAQQPVDVVLLDVEMPELNGIETTRQLKKSHPAVKVLAVSMAGDFNTVRQMLRAGADGYLVKNTGKNELRQALEVVAQGQIYLSPELAPVLLHGVAERPLPHAMPVEPLTKREREIVALIVEGLTNEQIARQLFLSPLTVNTHRKNMLSKLGCPNTAALVRYVIERRLLE